jgi:hypothetical protein
MKVHLARLAELEFLVAHRGKQGQRFCYELLYQGEEAEGRARLLGLIDCASLQVSATPGPAPTTTATSRGVQATSRGEAAHFAAPGRGVVGGGCGPVGAPETSAAEPLRFKPVPGSGNRGTGPLPPVPVLPYPILSACPAEAR